MFHTPPVARARKAFPACPTVLFTKFEIVLSKLAGEVRRFKKAI